MECESEKNETKSIEIPKIGLEDGRFKKLSEKIKKIYNRTNASIGANEALLHEIKKAWDNQKSNENAISDLLYEIQNQILHAYNFTNKEECWEKAKGKITSDFNRWLGAS